MWVGESPGEISYRLDHAIPSPTWLLTLPPGSQGYGLLMFMSGSTSSGKE